jgi:hypothetical protein
MHNATTDFFVRLHGEDYGIIIDIVAGLDHGRLWQGTPEGVSLANLCCHVVEMERFWIDWGFAGVAFERDRNREFTRHGDLSSSELVSLLEERRDRTRQQVAACTSEAWQVEREFHGDRFTGSSILLRHIHHLGLHRGHMQAHDRWLGA